MYNNMHYNARAVNRSVLTTGGQDGDAGSQVTGSSRNPWVLISDR